MNLQAVSGTIPQNLKNNAIYEAFKEAYMKVSMSKVHSLYSDYEWIIDKYHNYHKGERLFIVATGPSLNKTPLDLLKNEIVMGVNSAYIMLPQFKYHVISDGSFFVKHDATVLGLDNTLFLASMAGVHYLSHVKHYKKIKKTNPTMPIRSLESFRNIAGIPDNIKFGLFDGETVIISCLQIAYHMGFKEVYLIGCDCDYSGQEHFNASKVTSKTMTYITGDWSDIFSDYNKLNKIFENSDRKIYNSTVGGKLEVFKRKPLEEVLGHGLTNK